MKSFRDYQEKADQAISEELLINDKCLVKMFCGTGKSLLMRNCDVVKDKKLLVYVFPTLSLIDQFVSDYLFDFEDKKLSYSLNGKQFASPDINNLHSCFLKSSSMLFNGLFNNTSKASTRITISSSIFFIACAA